MLSTYSVLLLVVFFLQGLGILPKVDPSTIASSGSKPAVDDAASLDCTVPVVLKPDASLPHTKLGELTIGFMTFLCTFGWDAQVASVRRASALPRIGKPRAWHVQPLCVEDPFETHLNTCRRVNPRGQRLVLNATTTALHSLLAGGSVTELMS